MGNCCDLFQSTSTTSAASSSAALRVCFCQKYKAPSVSLTNQRLCAEGAGAGGTVLCDTPIDQLRAFWEFTIEDMGSNQGHFSIGVMRRANLKPPPNDKQVLLFFVGILPPHDRTTSSNHNYCHHYHSNYYYPYYYYYCHWYCCYSSQLCPGNLLATSSLTTSSLTTSSLTKLLP